MAQAEMMMRNYLVLVAMSVLGCGGGSKEKRNTDLAVTGTPTGKLEGKLEVKLVFSKAMVARDQLGKAGAIAPLTFAPDLPAEAKWADDKTLVLVPKAGVPVSTKFTATVPEGTKALDGSELGDAYAFEFTSERLDGSLDIVGTRERAKRDQVVRVSFNHEVPFEQVTQHCGFDGGGQHHAVKVAPEATTTLSKVYTIAPAGELTADADWTVSCRADVRGSVGNLGLEKALEEKFRTYGPLKYTSLKPSGTDIIPDENLRLAIAFTNPLAPPYQMTLTPAVPGFPAQCHALGDSPPGLSCAAQLDAQKQYTLTIEATQKDVFGQTIDKKQVIEFRTTDAKPTVSMESGYFVAELKRPVLPVWTRNVKELELTVVDVTQANFHKLRPALDWWKPEPIDLAATKLQAKTKKLAVTGTKNQWGQHPVDPAELFGRKAGPGMYYVEIGSAEVDKPPYENGGRQKVLVNFTDIGVVSKLSPSRGLVWATQLSTGKPLPGATVSVRDGSGKQTWTGTTDADGVAMLPGTAKLSGARAPAPVEEGEGEGGETSDELRVYVQSGADFTMINPTRTGGLSPYSFNVSVDYDRAPTKLRGFMHTDRGLYRPGEKVHVKGFARASNLGQPLTVPGQGKLVKVEVEGPQGKTFTTAEAKLSAFGGFWFDVDLPGDARLGDYMIRAKLEHGTFTRDFTVEQYRAATFEVSGKAATAHVVRRGTVKATVSAKYLYGAPLRAGNVDIAVHSRPRRVDFKGFEAYGFLDQRRYDSYYDESEHSQSLVTEDHVALDATGNAALNINVSPNDIHSDVDLLIRANVASPTNEVISKTFTVPYFRSRKYFGIKSKDAFVDVKKPQKLEIIAVSPDGKLVDGGAKVTVTRRDWNCVWEDWGYRGSYQCKDDNKQILAKTVQLVGGKPAEVEFTPETGGDYWITVAGESDKDEAATASMQLYAWGDGGGSWRSDDTQSMDIAADKKEYKPGDTATLILKTDLSDAQGLVTIERDGVIEKRLIKVSATQKHITVPITANHAPNVYVSVALVQKRMGDGARGKPRMRMGIVNLPVRPQDNKLAITVETDKQDYRPGGQVTATVKVVDAAGKPVSAEVSITAADEGVLSLIGYATPNPIPTFWAPWGIAVTTATQLEFIRDIPGPNLDRPATGGDAAGTLRSRFASTAVWTPAAVTNAAGLATVTFAAPDNLTAFRVMAVAADKTYRFGSGDKRFTVSKPLQLHQAMPRFVNLGDTAQAGVVVHNETGKAGKATVKLVADKRVTVTGPLERVIDIAKATNVPVLFDLAGAELGEATLGFTVTLNGESDGLETKIPVLHPSAIVTTSVAAGATKDAATIPIALPPEAIAASAELSISVDPDGLAGLEDGLRDLVHYPYGCLEQTTSKMIPMLAVRDLAESLNLDGLSGDKLDGFVKAGVSKIGRHQTAYGGFSLWPGGEPDAYYTAYALWGLYLAKQSGYAVDQTRVADGLQYLRGDGKSPDTGRPYYNESGNLGSQAFALYVRAVLGDKDAPATTKLLENPKLPIYGKAFVARSLAASVGPKDPAVTKVVGELGELARTAAAADKLIEETGNMGGYMSTSQRTTAIVLATLVELDPKHAAIRPLVNVLMKHRRKTRYWDTQSTLYSLLGLTSYAKVAALQGAPSVTIEVGDKQVVTGALAGKQRMRIATVALPASTALKITPKGEVNYNVQLRYRKQVSALKPESTDGLVLAREYLDEGGKPKSTFQVGDIVVVKLTLTIPSGSSHLMVSDPMPAGFEALNSKFATVGSAGVRQTQHWGTFRELYDDRVDFATEYTWQGSHTYEYTMRATTAGKFARPPARAELMYEPKTYSRTAVDIIEVKPR